MGLLAKGTANFSKLETRKVDIFGVSWGDIGGVDGGERAEPVFDGGGRLRVVELVVQNGVACHLMGWYKHF